MLISPAPATIATAYEVMEIFNTTIEEGADFIVKFHKVQQIWKKNKVPWLHDKQTFIRPKNMIRE